jgi:hypothetical protein
VDLNAAAGGGRQRAPSVQGLGWMGGGEAEGSLSALLRSMSASDLLSVPRMDCRRPGCGPLRRQSETSNPIPAAANTMQF